MLPPRPRVDPSVAVTARGHASARAVRATKSGRPLLVGLSEGAGILLLGGVALGDVASGSREPAPGRAWP